MDYSEIGQHIRNSRKSKGMSQEDLAELINISTTHMSHIETGKTKLSLQVFADIASALNVSADELLQGELTNQNERFCKKIETILSRCSTKEAQIISDTITSLKLSMDEHL